MSPKFGVLGQPGTGAQINARDLHPTIWLHHGRRTNPSSFVVTKYFGTTGKDPIAISTSSLPSGSIGTAYRTHIDIIGGTGSQDATWEVTSGQLPPGLALTRVADEELGGTPTKVGTYTFTLKAYQNDQSASKQFTVVIGATGSTTSAILFNCLAESADTPISATIATTAYSAPTGSVSTRETIPAGNDPLTFKRSGGQVVLSATKTFDGNFRYVVIPVGNSADGYNVIVDSFDKGSGPAAGTCWVTVYNGVKGLTETIDFYLLPPGKTVANTPYKTLGVAPFATTTTMVPTIAKADIWTIVATEPGQPTNVVASGPIGIGPTFSYFTTLVSPIGKSAQFLYDRDHF